jgi:hypothetical protein
VTRAATLKKQSRRRFPRQVRNASGGARTLKGPETLRPFDQLEHPGEAPIVALSFLYRLSRRVLEVIRVHWSDTAAKDAEILVLRHQLAVLRRQVARPRFTWSDRALVALVARLVPRELWGSFLVTPQTILGWHRSLVRRRWTFPHRRAGRPAIPKETTELICRLARENPRYVEPEIMWSNAR